MKGLKIINSEVERILKENKSLPRIWTYRYKNNLMQIQKKIDIIESYGGKHVKLSLVNRMTNNALKQPKKWQKTDKA